MCKARDLLTPMNVLIVGTADKTVVLEHLPSHFLLIDDGPIIDAFPKKRATRLDFSKHSFNPMAGMDDRKARDFISILNAIFPEGENTLTKKNSNHLLLKTLLTKPRNLKGLLHRIHPDKSDSAATDAYQKIENLLLSPVLEKVFCTAQNFSTRGILLARLNRAELGDFICKVIAYLLIGQYKGQVVIPDFGFYGLPHHVSLIRQDRLIAGVNYLDETVLKNELLMVPTKIGQHTTAKDAECLAQYAGYLPHTVEYNDFVQGCMK